MDSLFPLSPLFPMHREIPAQSGLRGLLLAFMLFCCYTSNAQDSLSAPPRPKIGLVLSGGGAKGFAHIGVLKVLEEAGIKIDYIGGTSMGSVIGGLYASGYNASQIDSIFRETNFDELIQDYIPRSSKSFFEKRNDERYAITLPFNKFSIGIPLAYSKGMYNYNLLTRLTHKVRHINDFSKLPIPFVCIATDIEKGEEVVLKSGYLPQAILASSAFPTLFSPVEIDGKMLIDGGVTNNYPVEEVRKMGADIIIGVDVQDDLKDRNALKEATRILVQISNLQMIESMKGKIAKTDIYIKPDITQFNVISFDQGQEIIKKGEEAARMVWDKLEQYGYKKEYKLPHFKSGVDSLTINMIENNVLRNYTRAYIIGKLGFRQGSTISYDQLKVGINNLNATQNFSSINYTIMDNGDGDQLQVLLKENPNKTLLKFGLHYDGLFKSAVLANITQKKVLLRNDVLSLDVGLGDNFRYNLDYYIDNGFYFSFGLNSKFIQFNRNVFTDFRDGALFAQNNIQSLNVDFYDFTHQAYVQTVFAQKFLIGSGLEFKHITIKSSTLDRSNRIIEDSDYGSFFGYLKYDSLDNVYFPSKGWFFNGNFQSFLFSSNFSGLFNQYSIVQGKAGIARKFLKRLTLSFDTGAGFSIGNESVQFMNFVLGGYGFHEFNNFKSFYGYDFVSIAGDSYIKSAASIDFEFYKKNHLNFSANIANVENNLFDSVDWIKTPQYTGFALGYGLETVIGPVEIKYSWSPELAKGYTWFNIGFKF